MHYRHPRAGFAFDLPDEWELDDASMSADGVIVVLRLGDMRLLLQVRRTQGNAAARLKLMTGHLESVRAAHITPCPPPPFGQSRDIVALSFRIAGHQQRWVSVGQDGYDYTLSHTDDWQAAATAVDRLATSFIFPAPAQIGRALSALAQPIATGAQGTHDAERWAAPGTKARWTRPAALSSHAMRDPEYRLPAAAASGLWQRFSARLRRGS